MGQQHVSSRPITLEVRIPQDQAGIVIGRGGQTIKEIQSRSNTRIHFKDELATNDYRFIAVIGLPDDVKLAEILIHQIIANQPSTENFVMHIPSTFIGPIIGRNGESIRSLQDRSGCHIDIERYICYCFVNKTWGLHTEVRFASFLSGGFITAIIVSPPERKLPKRTSVDWGD